MLNNQTPSLGWNDGAKLLLLQETAKFLIWKNTSAKY